MRNPADVYRTQSVYTAPPNVQLAQLHQQSAIWTRGIREDVSQQQIAEARQKITYIQDIITYLRASLDFKLEAARQAESTYIFYYNLYVSWFMEPNRALENQEEYDAMLEFWESWARTWLNVPKDLLSSAL